MKTTLHIEGMTCSHCESTIQDALLKRLEIQQADVYASRDLAVIKHTEPLILSEVTADLEKLGYAVIPSDSKRWIQVLLSLAALILIAFLLLRYSGSLSFDFLPNIRQNMGYGALFLVGLLTSVHCIAMCGGINLSQCNKYKHLKPSKPSLLYNLGRVTSYTVLGGIIGGIGSVLSFSGQSRGYVTIAVSVIMILMAIKMLKVFQVKLPKIPLPRFVTNSIKKLGNKGPYFVGLANGFMPCGPLQSMQLYALGTGSVVRGALSMFYFSIGTFPLMFALGFISSMLQHKFSKHIMKFSALLIFALGVTMLSRGAALAGIVNPFSYNGQIIEASLESDNLQVVNIDLKSNQYDPIQIKKNVPVKLVIHADPLQMNGCNNPITIPALDIEQTLIPGENIIYFTADTSGKLTYTCWMGMITSYIEVVD